MTTGSIDNRLLEQLGIQREPLGQKRNDQLGQADFLKLMFDPQWYSTMLAVVDPALMQQWMKLMMEPEMLDSMMKMMDPNLMVQFMRAAASLIGREVLVPGNSMLHMAGEREQIAVELPNAVTDVEVNVYTASGQLVDTLRLGPQQAGLLSIEWDGTDAQGNPVPTGNYRFEATLRTGTSTEAANLFVATRVLSVSLDRNRGDMQLETEGLGRVDFSDVRRIS